jgi:hypothetical protein
MLFQSFPYDFPLLWTSEIPTAEFYNHLEAHLSFLNSSPALIPRILHIVIALGLLGFILKLHKPSEANVLFDGASLVLYFVGLTMYAMNIVKGLRVVNARDYESEIIEGESSFFTSEEVADRGYIGREETMKVLAASNTILAFVLLGVLILQAGQWYAEKKEEEETEKFEKEAEKKAAVKTGGKKKAA